jgi:hypothetical protein
MQKQLLQINTLSFLIDFANRSQAICKNFDFHRGLIQDDTLKDYGVTSFYDELLQELSREQLKILDTVRFLQEISINSTEYYSKFIVTAAQIHFDGNTLYPSELLLNYFQYLREVTTPSQYAGYFLDIEQCGRS